VRIWPWQGGLAVSVHTRLSPDECTARLRASLVRGSGNRPAFNGRVHEGWFEVQRWWGWFSRTRRALAGRIRPEPGGARIELWVRPGLIAQMGAALALASPAAWLLGLVFGGGSELNYLTIVCCTLFALGLLASLWKNPLGETDLPELVKDLIDLLELKAAGRAARQRVAEDD
jgi:hypothetical protein